jgi:uncharacterized protein YegL
VLAILFAWVADARSEAAEASAALDPQEITGDLREGEVRNPGRLETFGEETAKTEEKLIVLVHGWNPSGQTNPYTSGAWGAVTVAWARQRAQYPGWRLVGYTWEKDADTGGKLLAPWHGTAAAKFAYWHGWRLGDMLLSNFPRVKEVQFIAHSAGSWAARSAALCLAQSANHVRVQLTLLDPYMTMFPAASTLDAKLMGRLDQEPPWEQAAPRLFENYFASDISGPSTAQHFHWTRVTNVQASIDYNQIHNILTNSSALLSAMEALDMVPVISAINVGLAWVRQFEGHGLPVAWYAATMLMPTCYDVGWSRSLPYTERQPPGVSRIAVIAAVDESGSMAGAKLRSAQRGVAILQEMLSETTREAKLGIVGFANQPRLLCPLTDVRNSQAFGRARDTLNAKGGTGVGRGLEEALEALQDAEQTNRSVVLLSDGGHNEGDLWGVVQNAARLSVPVHTVALESTPAETETMRRIARETGGQCVEADLNSLEQVYAAIGANVSRQCVYLYRTHVIQQDGAVDFDLKTLDANLPPILVPGRGLLDWAPWRVRVVLSWPGSRLNLKVLDATGRDCSTECLGNIQRRDRLWTAQLLRSPARGGVLRVVGEEVEPGGEPFTLQVTGNGTSGVYVAPMRTLYRIGEDVALQGEWRGKDDLSGGILAIEGPSGRVRQVPFVASTEKGQGRRWRSILGTLDTIGIHQVRLVVQGRCVYEGAFLCGSVAEVVTRRSSALALLDDRRLRLRREYEAAASDDILARYASLTYLASIARVIDVMQPVLSGIGSNEGEHGDQRRMSLLLPFTGPAGSAESLSIIRGGRVTVGNRPENDAGIPAGPEKLIEEQSRYWIRLSGEPGMACEYLIACRSSAPELIKTVLGPFKLSQRFETIDVLLQRQVNRRTIDVITAVERDVNHGTLSRLSANAFYQAFVTETRGQIMILVIANRWGEAVFVAGGEEATGPDYRRPLSFDVTQCLQENRQALGSVTARLLLETTPPPRRLGIR